MGQGWLAHLYWNIVTLGWPSEMSLCHHIMWGYHPNISVHPEQDLTSTKAHDYVIDLDELHKFLHSEMAHT